MRGGVIRYLEKGLDVCFVCGQRIVFLKNDCSNPLERLFFSKMIVLTPWNVCFSKKCLFQPLGTSAFLKNDCSNPLERLFFLKTDENGGWFRLFLVKMDE
ncbi:hypothetical protein, partial [Segatella oulorum]|uniref:hypothetical protein n=1 Tax=Segatella oulorum TaxID=28136 RepID=UPI0028E6F2A2